MGDKLVFQTIPKEYVAYTEEEKIIKTEEMALDTEQKYQKVEKIEETYRIRINQSLKIKALDELYELLNDDDFLHLCNCIDDFYWFRYLLIIAKEEERVKEASILQKVDTMEQGREVVQKIIFCFRRAEFEWEDNLWKEELMELHDKYASSICLAEILFLSSIVRKVLAGSFVAEILHRCGQRRNALMFLIWLEGLLPYSDVKVMTLATSFLEMGEIKLAYETLMKHENVNADIKSLQIKLAEML